MIAPLDPFSEVVDERRRWNPEWYSWLKDLERETAGIGAAVALPDTDDSHVLAIELGSDLTDDRTLTIVTGDADRTLTLVGDATISGTSSGTNTGDQTITLTGDVTGTGTGSFATTIPAASIDFAQIQNIATDKLAGRDTAASGSLEEIAVSGGIEFTGAGAIQTGAFTGDVTKAAGGTALTIADEAVTISKTDMLFRVHTADESGTNTTTEQQLFPSNGAVDVAASTTYLMEAEFSIRKTTTAANNFLSFAIAGTATLTSIGYHAIGARGTGAAITDFCDSNWILTAAATAVTNNTVLNQTDYIVLIKGIVRVNAAGTLIPQFQFALTPGATVTIFANSYFRLTPIGDDTVSSKGTWT